MQKKQGKKPASTGSVKAVPGHRVRIIGGRWKRTPLAVLDAEGLRPTPDRVRETVFNWLHHLLDGHWEHAACLDLFAGSGALGFEAASRGAARVVLCESSAAACRQLEATRQKLQAQQVSIVRGDAVATAHSMGMPHADQAARFNVIFLDPPYHQDWLATLLPTCEKLLAEAGLVYAEMEQPLDGETPPAWLAGWEVVRAGKAGLVFYHLLRRNKTG